MTGGRPAVGLRGVATHGGRGRPFLGLLPDEGRRRRGRVQERQIVATRQCGTRRRGEWLWSSCGASVLNSGKADNVPLCPRLRGRPSGAGGAERVPACPGRRRRGRQGVRTRGRHHAFAAADQGCLLQEHRAEDAAQEETRQRTYSVSVGIAQGC